MQVFRFHDSDLATGFLVRSKTDEETKVTRVVASTDDVDRYGDVVDQTSWDLRNYLKNPVVLENHYGIVVGRSVSASVEDGALIAEIEWDEDDTNPSGKRIASQFRRGFMNAVSVGFRSRTITRRSDLPEDHPAFSKGGGLFLQNNELYEISAVGIPANPNAIVTNSLDPEQIRAFVDEAIGKALRDQATIKTLFSSIRKNAFATQPSDDIFDTFGF